jgi:hypothetical protein
MEIGIEEDKNDSECWHRPPKAVALGDQTELITVAESNEKVWRGNITVCFPSP